MKNRLLYRIAIIALIIISVLYFLVLFFGLNILSVSGSCVKISFEHFGSDKKLNLFGTTGDTIGGIFSPLISIVASLLTYWAFKEQVDANRIQFAELSLSKFETRFNLLLTQHRENTEKLELDEDASFEAICETYKFIHLVLTNEIKNTSLMSKGILSSKEEYYGEDVNKIAFAVLLFGLNSVFDNRDDKFNINIKGSHNSAYMHALQKIYDYEKNSIDYLGISYNKITDGTPVHFSCKNRKKLMNGYGRALENYLYNFDSLFRYVFEKWINEPDVERRRSIRDSFRVLEAQLTSDELLLLFFYSLSDFSDTFESHFHQSGLVDHVPTYLVDFIPTNNIKDKYPGVDLGRYAKVFKRR